MPSKLGKYTLLHTLGQGAYSKVKLALNSEDGKEYAIKIHRKSNPRVNKGCVEVVVNEARAMTKIHHKNIVNIVDFMDDGIVEKPDGTSYEVVAVVVVELVTNGELFHFVKNSGYFKETYARYYFHQIMDGLDYVHKTAGLSHRDIKPDNILVDGDFNIKIADFGFAGPLAGRTGDGYLKTKLGTEPYQAPEINERQPYKGEAVDLFAAAIVLFIMVSGTPPFTKAERDEFYYKLIAGNRFDLFWRYHVKGKPSGAKFFSEEFKNLIE